ncbi:hypothetical protein BYI23_A020640 [Burkholderia sp. YI23]|nr:hypothetical protein BYI23_A020640 [Burkholderia sp. YI23]
MKLLLDTHLLIWAAGDDPALSEQARSLIEDPNNTLYFSVQSIWEIVIKSSLQYPDFQLDARVFRTNLLDAGYNELSIEAHHALEVQQLPPIHRDPFDRMLIAQAISEGIVLLTHDDIVRQYESAPVQYV